MKTKIRYAVNGKEYEEEIIEIVFYGKDGNQAVYVYSTISDDLGFCIMDSKHDNQVILKGNPTEEIPNEP